MKYVKLIELQYKSKKNAKTTLYFALQLNPPNDNSPTTPSPCPQIDPASMV